VGAERALILIDTNVFVIDLRYKQDTHYRTNRKFLDVIGEAGNGFTTVINLLHTLSLMITWDKAHFEGKFPGNLFTPAEFPHSR